jgi:hypothetical protein
MVGTKEILFPESLTLSECDCISFAELMTLIRPLKKPLAARREAEHFFQISFRLSPFGSKRGATLAGRFFFVKKRFPGGFVFF